MLLFFVCFCVFSIGIICLLLSCCSLCVCVCLVLFFYFIVLCCFSLFVFVCFVLLFFVCKCVFGLVFGDRRSVTVIIPF